MIFYVDIMDNEHSYYTFVRDIMWKRTLCWSTTSL